MYTSLLKKNLFELNNEIAFFRTSKARSLVLIDLYVQTINVSKTKELKSDKCNMSNMVVIHSYTACEGAVSLFSAHSFDKLAFCGYQLKAKHRLSFLFIPALCSCVTVKWMLFYVFSIFYTICRIGSLLSALIFILFLLCVVLVAYIIILLCH